ncbi:hypothetical protein EJB05_24073, partial [Eragrostis curvula]
MEDQNTVMTKYKLQGGYTGMQGGYTGLIMEQIRNSQEETKWDNMMQEGQSFTELLLGENPFEENMSYGGENIQTKSNEISEQNILLQRNEGTMAALQNTEDNTLSNLNTLMGQFQDTEQENERVNVNTDIFTSFATEQVIIIVYSHAN